jgi:transposase, IS5 family
LEEAPRREARASTGREPRVAHEAGALGTKDLKRVRVDTTVQPKAITFPTDAKLLHAAIQGLNRLARRHPHTTATVLSAHRQAGRDDGGALCPRQEFNRHHRQLRLLRIRLGRIIRDIRRKIAGKADLEALFEWPLMRTNQIRSQQQRQRGWKLYSFHAPEVECTGKGKASAPYEFGVKASIATNQCPRARRPVRAARQNAAGNPYDGHTLGVVIEDTERLTGCEIERAYVDKGYRGHRAANPCRVFISGQKHGVFGVTKRELRRRCAIEAVIEHRRPTVTSAAAISRAAKAMPPTSSLPPSATTSDLSWPGLGLSVA